MAVTTSYNFLPEKSEFTVNTQVAANQQQSSVTALNNGGFFVSYLDPSSGQSDVRGRFFSKTGVAGSDIPVAGSSVEETALSVTTLTNGNIVVGYMD